MAKHTYFVKNYFVIQYIDKKCGDVFFPILLFFANKMVTPTLSPFAKKKKKNNKHLTKYGER